MMNVEYVMGLAIADLPLYDPTCFQRMEKAFSSLFCGNYVTPADSG